MKKTRPGSRPSAEAIAAAAGLARRYRLTGSVKAVEQAWVALLHDLIRKREIASTDGVASLRVLLAPFRRSLDELRRMVDGLSTGFGGGSSTTGHGVPSEAQGLPTGGEPSDDPDEEAIRRLLGLGRKVLGRKS